MTEKRSIIEEQKMKYMKELRSPLFWKCTLAEFIATTLYSFIANTLCATNESTTRNSSDCSRARNSSGMLLAATGIGLSVATLSYVFRTQYGCYMNPAVSFGQFTCWRFSFVKTFVLLLMQMSGGIAGVAISYTIRADHRHSYLGISHQDMTSTEGVIGQFIPSFIIVMVVLVSSDERRSEKDSVASMLYGIVSVMAVLVAGQHSECAINPARILGLAIILNRWTHPIWIYWVGSISGGILAGIVYQLLFRHSSSDELSQLRQPMLFNSNQRLSRDKPLPILSRGMKGTRGNKGLGTSSFWKKQEMIPFIKDDTLTKNTIV